MKKPVQEMLDRGYAQVSRLQADSRRVRRALSRQSEPTGFRGERVLEQLEFHERVLLSTIAALEAQSG